MSKPIEAAAEIAGTLLFIAGGLAGCHGLWIESTGCHWAVKCLLMPWAFFIFGIATIFILLFALAPILIIFSGDESGGCDAAL